MNGQILHILSFVAIMIGIILPESGQAQRPQPESVPSYVLVPKSARRIKARMSFEYNAPRVQADEWTVYITQLPELPGQVNVRTTLFPQGTPARDLSEEARPMFFVRIPSEGPLWSKNIAVRVEYEAILIERKLEPREPGATDPSKAPAAPTLDPLTRRLELLAGHQFDHQSPSFRNWLKDNDLRRVQGENEVDFARKAYLVVRKKLKHYEGAGIEHLASRVCEAGRSDFAGLTAVYVSALRANGIPARALCGRMVIHEGKPTKNSWPHAKVEFFAQGIGWVPVNMAGALRSGRPVDGLEFFGNDSAEFLTTHIDTDLVIDTYFGQKVVELLPDAMPWVIGSGTFDGAESKNSLVVEVEPLDLAETLARRTAPTPARKQTTKKQAAKKSR